MNPQPETTSTKLTHALILNALIFPGSGHYALGMRRRGATLMIATTVFLFWPLIRYMAAVLAPLHAAGRVETPVLRTLEVMGDAWTQTRGTILFCIAALLITWIYGIVEIAVRMRRSPGGK